MPRYVLEVQYDGLNYSGWQAQENVSNTVQGTLDRALKTVLRTPVETYGAGRTDAGVHALCLPAHFDLPHALHPSFRLAINAVLPETISVRRIWEATRPDFHTRFDALYRKYRYLTVFHKSPLLQNRAWWHKRPLDIAAMQAAADTLFDYDSFEAFCKSHGNNKTYFCRIQEARFAWEGDVLVFHIQADRFLRGMVRAIMGTLTEVGLGKLSVAEFRGVIEAKRRTEAGQSAPPWGLYLADVGFREGELVEWVDPGRK